MSRTAGPLQTRDGSKRGVDRDSVVVRPSDGRGPGRTRGRHVRSRRRCSVCSAIHTSSRGWPRSSSTREPSDPPLRVVNVIGLKALTRKG